MGERKKILPQMFDVRPVDEAGNLDLEKINKIEKITRLPEKVAVKNNRPKVKKIRPMNEVTKPEIIQNPAPRFKNEYSVPNQARKEKVYPPRVNRPHFENIGKSVFELENEGASYKFNWPDARLKRKPPEEYFLKPIRPRAKKNWRGKFYLSLKIAAALLVVFLILNGAYAAYQLKTNGYSQGEAAILSIESAKSSLEQRNFQAAAEQFQKANEQFNAISDELGAEGVTLADATKYFPYLSKAASSTHLVAAGKDLSQAGVLASNMLEQLNALRTKTASGAPVSYLKFFQDNENNLKTTDALLKDAQSNLASVNADDLPDSYKDKYIQINQYVGKAAIGLDDILGQKNTINDILGGNGPRKYLFLFENNQEMRATGGFIGSYGELDIFNGKVEKFFMDGIYDPDGQLKTRIVPPGPIQKISANWSMHDSNWWPDFPTSVQKTAWFYEQAGGPTVDGVITITPTVLQDLLAITGPIPMPDYGVTVDQDNFIPLIQYKVETDYDKAANHPKQILSDLAPKIISKIINDSNLNDVVSMANSILGSLNEKQIQVYSRNPQVESLMDQNDWSGRILSTPKDYFGVINTNINGFKTDGVIDENISHDAHIQPDGSVLDTLTITRHHNGGNTPYDWWNQVNDDYMRVYVPEGAELLSASGQTREIDTPPLDYAALGYQRDPMLQAEEKAATIDQNSGTRIYDEDGKTVFANWVYVSPQETVTVKYTYLLPFKVAPTNHGSLGTYSLLAQKQAGSLGSKLESTLEYPGDWSIVWENPGDGLETPNGLPDGQKGVKMETDLKTDKFIGLAFTK